MGIFRSCDGDNGFWSKMEEMVAKILSTTTISILVNGSPSAPFRMERGLMLEILYQLFCLFWPRKLSTRR